MNPISSNAIFHVKDIKKSLEFYKNLGFSVEFEFGEPLTYVGLVWGDTRLHIADQYPYKDNVGHGSMYLVFEDVDELYNKFLKNNLGFLSHIENREYGMRDFAIMDLDGNQIGFGAALNV